MTEKKEKNVQKKLEEPSACLRSRDMRFGRSVQMTELKIIVVMS
jgi:hypothetical protein